MRKLVSWAGLSRTSYGISVVCRRQDRWAFVEESTRHLNPSMVCVVGTPALVAGCIRGMADRES